MYSLLYYFTTNILWYFLLMHVYISYENFLMKLRKIKVSPHVRESKTLLDSGFHAVDSGFQLLDSRSFSVELWFRIRIVSGIPDSYTCIPDSKAQDSGFHKQKFSKIPDSKCKNFPDSGILYMGRKVAVLSSQNNKRNHFGMPKCY